MYRYTCIYLYVCLHTHTHIYISENRGPTGEHHNWTPAHQESTRAPFWAGHLSQGNVVRLL